MSDYTANVGRMPWRLHDDLETAVGPKLAEPFLDVLDGVTHVDPTDQATAAYAWLAWAHPTLHAAVVLVEGRGLSEREAGRRLGVTHRTVGKRVDAGLAKVRARCLKGDSAA